MKNKVVIVGAGTAGVTVAARLHRYYGHNLEITIIDPQEKHFYQPLWTLVGAGVFKHEDSERMQKDVIPTEVKWDKRQVIGFSPETNEVIVQGDIRIGYDYLVVAAGIQLDWDKIRGMPEALNTPGVCSNYLPYGSKKTWQEMQNTTEGNAIFTQPPLPIKCAGAPQKAMYLGDDYFRNENRRDKINVIFATQGPRIFGVEKYRKTLEGILERKHIDTRFEHELIEIKSDDKIAVFKRPDGSLVEIKYAFIHVVPPMSSPNFIKSSKLADQSGWVDVDQFTLQHIRYKNVFSLGDCSNLPTSRTGAAIRKQAPVLASNLINLIEGMELVAKYDGYTSCPLVTGYGKVIMAEFDYDGKPAETFPFDQSKERYSMWLVKAHLLPKLYWYGMLKGYA